MVWAELMCALVAVVATTWLARRQWGQEIALQGFSCRLREDAARLVELRYQYDLRVQLSQAQDLAETVVDTGTATVQEVHMGISRIPFGILESIPVTRDTSKVVRQAHDLISDAVYGSIRGINKSASRLSRDAFSLSGKRRRDEDKHD